MGSGETAESRPSVGMLLGGQTSWGVESRGAGPVMSMADDGDIEGQWAIPSDEMRFKLKAVSGEGGEWSGSAHEEQGSPLTQLHTSGRKGAPR